MSHLQSVSSSSFQATVVTSGGRLFLHHTTSRNMRDDHGIKRRLVSKDSCGEQWNRDGSFFLFHSLSVFCHVKQVGHVLEGRSGAEGGAGLDVYGLGCMTREVVQHLTVCVCECVCVFVCVCVCMSVQDSIT